MQLTPSQQQGMLDFKEFIMNPKKSVASITGPAGVGKSFFIDQCLANLDSLNNKQAYLGNDPIEEVAICATTNKAAKVLLDMPHAQGDTRTIYSKLGLRVQRDYKTGKDRIVKNGNYESRGIQQTLVVVDEASYSDSVLEKYMLDSIYRSKLILVGDDCQLTSVNEPDFNIFKQKYIETEITLTENMRFNPNSSLGQLNAELRDWVYHQDKRPVITPNGQDIVFADDQSIFKYIERTFKYELYGDTRVIAFKNQTCVNYNTHIRQLLGFSKLPNKDEKLVVATAYMPGGKGTGLHVDAELAVIDTPTVVEEHYDIEGIWVDTNKGRYLMPCDYQQYRQRLNQLARTQKWGLLYEIKDTFLDARPDYARTTHKAQGSTHDCVIIDMHDLLTMPTKDQLIRAIYVAISRARKKVIIYGYPN